MTKTLQTPVKVAAALILAVICLCVLFYSFGAGFAANGGSVAVFSPSNDVQIESDTVGDVVTVAGNRNRIERPYEPETAAHKRGEWAGLLFFVAVFFGIVGYIYYRANDLDLLWSKQ